MKTLLKIILILVGTVLALKGIQLLVDYLYRRCCNSYIETDCDEQF